MQDGQSRPNLDYKTTCSYVGALYLESRFEVERLSAQLSELTQKYNTESQQAQRRIVQLETQLAQLNTQTPK